MKNSISIIGFVAALAVIGPASFYGGLIYGKSQTPGAAGFNQFQNLSAEERQARSQQFQQNGGARRLDGQAGIGFTSGEILSKDDATLTIKLPDGGSKIVFYAASTSINKTAEGSAADLTVGANVMVSGSANGDGSLTAQQIQIKPDAISAPASN